MAMAAADAQLALDMFGPIDDPPPAVTPPFHMVSEKSRVSFSLFFVF